MTSDLSWTWSEAVWHIGHELEVLGLPMQDDLSSSLVIRCHTCDKHLATLIEPSKRIRLVVLRQMQKEEDEQRKEIERAEEDEQDELTLHRD